MIFLYTGKTGSGKTFCMIKDAYRRWYRGEDIYSNTKLEFEKHGGKANTNLFENPENFTKLEKFIFILGSIWSKLRKKNKRWVPSRGKITYFQDISELIDIRDGVVLMDEAQNLLDARNWENLPLEFSNKLRQHRKHNIDLYATTQNMGTIDINMRRLVQRWSHCKDVFALFWIRNPSLLTFHKREFKDIDELYNKVDDLLVTTTKTTYFSIHRWTKAYYDTLYDIGFNYYKLVWLQTRKAKLALIIPKTWSLSNVRTQLSLMKFFYQQVNSKTTKKPKKSYVSTL